MQTRRQVLLLFSAALVAPSISLAGAWSHESFDNDGALDWAAEFQEKPTLQFIRQTLALATTGKYIESFAGESVIAAAEVVAASLGRPGKGLPPELAAVVADSGAKFRTLAPLAQSALAAVLGPKSELRESWSLHAEGLARWKGSVNELLRRLS